MVARLTCPSRAWLSHLFRAGVERVGGVDVVPLVRADRLGDPRLAQPDAQGGVCRQASRPLPSGSRRRKIGHAVGPVLPASLPSTAPDRGGTARSGAISKIVPVGYTVLVRAAWITGKFTVGEPFVVRIAAGRGRAAGSGPILGG